MKILCILNIGAYLVVLTLSWNNVYIVMEVESMQLMIRGEGVEYVYLQSETLEVAENM
jgi:hypothetical protein